MRPQRIGLGHLESGGARERAGPAGLVSQRHVEVVELQQHARNRLTIRLRHCDADGACRRRRAAPTGYATAASPPSTRRRVSRKKEPLLDVDRLVFRAVALQITRWRVTRVALASGVEEGFTRLRIAGQDVL